MPLKPVFINLILRRPPKARIDSCSGIVIKLKLQISLLVLLLTHICASAQRGYPIRLRGVDKDSATLVNSLGIQTEFATRTACVDYINRLQTDLQAKGYVTASIDSLRYDSSFAVVTLYTGLVYTWAQLNADQVDPTLLDAVGWRDKSFTNKAIDFVQVRQLQENLLTWLENNGHPFARVYLDSVRIDNDSVSALLKVNKGPLYKIDSIHVIGNAKISSNYLQRYLNIPNGSIYSKEKLLQIHKKVLELPYVEETQAANLTRLGTGSVLNMYLKQKRSSQVNVLIGFLPNNDQLSTKKLLLTGQANIHLVNALGAGETIGVNWQQLQVKSPQLNLLYQHPYLFNSPVGLDFSFDMFRKDSTFLNVNLQIGALYALNSTQSGKLFLQRFQTIVNGVNTVFILQNHKLPDEADVSSLNVGVDYEYNNTDYRYNPRKGNEFSLITAVGTKQLKKNNEIVNLKDPANASFDFSSLYDTVKLKTYQLRLRTMAAKYFPLGRGRSVIKTAVNAGIFQSGNTFRNELFQIGGYKLLRGFDEESQYLSQFAIGTLEYHYLVDLNSYFYVLADGGWGRNNSQNNNVNYTYFGTGIGLALQTKAGIFNLALAVGKRNDTDLNLRQSKIHFGFLNYF